MYRAVLECCILCAIACGVLGCQPEPGIRTYTVPKERARAVAVTPEAVQSAATHRMLVAVAPHGDQATFFKLTAPIDQVESVAADVKRFVESLQVVDNEPPTWKLPDGWREEAGNSVRLATILVPAGGATLELAVNRLPWQSSDAYLLSNINRWRGQMELPPIPMDQLNGSHELVKVGDRELIWLDLTGISSGGGMAPFANSPIGPQRPGDAAQNAGELPFEQEVPNSWKAIPATGTRRAAFAVGEGASLAEVTVFNFSTDRPQVASPLANVNMWRGAIGLAPTSETELAKSAQKVTISGKDGIFVTLESPDGHDPNEAILAAMSERDGEVWFFKMKGPRDTVLAERDHFQQWLESIAFQAKGE